MTSAGTASDVNGVRCRAAARATAAAFVSVGAVSASWTSRIPQIRASLHLRPAQVGVVLLAIAVGSLVSLPCGGVIVHRYTSRRTVAAMAVLLGGGLSIVCVGYHAGIAAVIVGFFLVGFAVGAWNVAMNVQGAIVERHLGRAVMSRFHAGYSIGTVCGAVLGAVAVLLKVPVTVHLLAVAVLTAGLVPWAVRGFVADTDAPATDAAGTDAGGVRSRLLARWTEPRTLLIGLFVLAIGFAEGSGYDWINIAFIDSYHVPAAVGTLGLATFLAAMTAGRWFGPMVLDRYGRVAVLRGLALSAFTGLLLFIFSPAVALAFLGVGLWGLGASLGFPVGMSAAADDPSAAAARVSVVASMAYCSFLCGPPLIGLLGDHVTVLRALLVVAALAAVSACIAGALRPLPPAGLAHPPTDDEGAL